MSEDTTTVKEEKKESVELAPKLAEVAKTIEGLTALELSELVKGLEDRLGIQAAAPMAAGMVMAGVAGAGVPEPSGRRLRHPDRARDLAELPARVQSTRRAGRGGQRPDHRQEPRPLRRVSPPPAAVQQALADLRAGRGLPDALSRPQG